MCNVAVQCLWRRGLSLENVFLSPCDTPPPPPHTYIYIYLMTKLGWHFMFNLHNCSLNVYCPHSISEYFFAEKILTTIALDGHMKSRVHHYTECHGPHSSHHSMDATQNPPLGHGNLVFPLLASFLFVSVVKIITFCICTTYFRTDLQITAEKII